MTTNKLVLLCSLVLLSQGVVKAGDTNRTGSAGASELLINPWARSSGWNGLNTANAFGIEAANRNIAGLATVEGTEAIFAHTNFWKGTGISLNSFGFAQKVGSASVLGLTVMSINFGNIEITTEANPDGGIGTYKPQFINAALCYARSFSKSVQVGVLVRSITESVSNVKAQGVSFDAGIQYIGGKNDMSRIGVSLRNIGPSMSFSGDGLSFDAINSNGDAQKVNRRSQEFNLPVQLNIGLSQGLKLGQNHTFTLATNFSSNSYTQDQIGIGGEYAFKKYLMLRGGYNYEEGILKYATRKTVYNGASMGATIELPLGKEGSTFAIDYSYVGAFVFGGNHAFGARLTF